MRRKQWEFQGEWGKGEELFFQKQPIGGIGVDATSFCSGGAVYDALLFHFVEDFIYGCRGQSGLTGQDEGTDDYTTLKEPQNDSGTFPRAALGGGPFGMSSHTSSQHGDIGGGLSRGDEHGFEKVFQPGFPIAGFTDRAQEAVVFLPVLFEEQTEVEERLAEQPTPAEHHLDEKASDAAVSIEEGMYAFELHVHHTSFQQGVNFIERIDEKLQIAHALQELLRGLGKFPPPQPLAAPEWLAARLGYATAVNYQENSQLS